MHLHNQIVERDEMLTALYGELRIAAARLLRREAPNLTMQPTELANEAAIRLMKLERMHWNNPQHFFAIGARIMRQAMLDAIRKRRSLKRQAPTILFADDNDETGVDVEALDSALERLEAVSPELARIVEMRFFIGLGIEEIAVITGNSESTIKRRWKTARLWLASELTAL